MAGVDRVDWVGLFGGVFFCGVTFAICTTREVSTGQAQRFLDVHAAVYNLFNLGRHLVSAEPYRKLGVGAFGCWTEAVV
jgi:hypothetical protein